MSRLSILVCAYGFLVVAVGIFRATEEALASSNQRRTPVEAHEDPETEEVSYRWGVSGWYLGPSGPMYLLGGCPSVTCDDSAACVLKISGTSVWCGCAGEGSQPLCLMKFTFEVQNSILYIGDDEDGVDPDDVGGSIACEPGTCTGTCESFTMEGPYGPMSEGWDIARCSCAP